MFFALVILVIISILLLKGFDKVAGRGPTQVADGIAAATKVSPAREERTCPCCAEIILSAAHICKHCGRDVDPKALA